MGKARVWEGFMFLHLVQSRSSAPEAAYIEAIKFVHGMKYSLDSTNCSRDCMYRRAPFQGTDNSITGDQSQIEEATGGGSNKCLESAHPGGSDGYATPELHPPSSIPVVQKRLRPLRTHLLPTVL